MADSAFQTHYRDELVAEFEEGMSWLRRTTVTEAVVKGNQATFLVAGSGGATATTRGLNGLIPARADNNNQLTATLTEWHDLVRKTRFNIFASQGNQRSLMQRTTGYVLNRRIDADIIAQLDTATNNIGSGTIDLSVISKAKVTLGNNEVPTQEEDNMFAVGTPAVEGYLTQTTEFTNADYVDTKYLNGPILRTRRWMGFNWIFHPNLTGVGTNAAKIYFFHRNAIGSAFDMENLNTAVGYDEEQDYSYARASSFTGAVVLQQNGLVQYTHDDSALS